MTHGVEREAPFVVGTVVWLWLALCGCLAVYVWLADVDASELLHRLGIAHLTQVGACTSGARVYGTMVFTCYCVAVRCVRVSWPAARVDVTLVVRV
jgi:hypothetical protein